MDKDLSTLKYAKALKDIRLEKGIPRRELSRASGLTYGLIRTTECGDYKSVESMHLSELAKGLGVTVEEIHARAASIDDDIVTLPSLRTVAPEIPFNEVQTLPHHHISDYEQRRDDIIRSSPRVNQVVRRLRHLHQITVPYLSKYSGVTQNAINKFERGEEDLRFDSRERIAKVFGIQPELLDPRTKYRILPHDLYDRVRAVAITQNITPDELIQRTPTQAHYLKNLPTSPRIPSKKIIENFAAVFQMSPQTLTDTRVAAKTVAQRSPKPHPADTSKAEEAWAQFDSHTEIADKPASVEPVPSPVQPPSRQTLIPDKTPKKYLEAEIMNRAQTLFALDNYSGKDLEELIDGLEYLFQIVKHK